MRSPAGPRPRDRAATRPCRRIGGPASVHGRASRPRARTPSIIAATTCSAGAAFQRRSSSTSAPSIRRSRAITARSRADHSQTATSRSRPECRSRRSDSATGSPRRTSASRRSPSRSATTMNGAAARGSSSGSTAPLPPESRKRGAAPVRRIGDPVGIGERERRAPPKAPCLCSDGTAPPDGGPRSGYRRVRPGPPRSHIPPRRAEGHAGPPGAVPGRRRAAGASPDRITRLEKRREVGGRGAAPAVRRRHEHVSEPRVHRQAREHAAMRGDPSRGVERPEFGEERTGFGQRRSGWRVRKAISPGRPAPERELQREAGQIGAQDSGGGCCANEPSSPWVQSR